jgi:DNA transformation protein
MPVSPGFRAFALDQLGRVTSGVHDRRMFGGVGIYADTLFFALVDDDVLYLKVDELTRAEFERHGMTPFRPAGDGGEVMNYYAVPGDLLEDVEALQAWVDRALAAARRQRERKPRKRHRR